MSDLVERLQKREYHFRHAVEGEYDANLMMKARFALDDSAARITELETALAEAEGRVKKMERALGNIRALATKHQAVCGPDGNWAHVEGFAATALETGEWKKDSPPPPPVV